MEIEVRGAEQLRKMSKAFKDAGEKDLQKQLRTGIRKAVDPLRKTALPQSALVTLPHKNHINQIISKSRYTVSIRTTGTKTGVRLVAKNKYNLERVDQGILRHPVFKRKNENHPRWVDQKVTPGWFSNPTKKAAPVVRQNVQEAMDEVARNIIRKVT